jgi:hypothetical protein
LEHRWGDGVGPLLAAAGDNNGSGSSGSTAGDGGSSKSGVFFNLVLACDVMYVDEAVPALVTTLAALARAGGTGGSGSGGSGGGDNGRGTEVLIAHGRNRGAEPAFLKAAAAAGLAVAAVPPSELDPVYQCSDVSVLRLSLAALDG